MKGEQFLLLDSRTSEDLILIFSKENNLKLIRSINYLVGSRNLLNVILTFLLVIYY